LSTIYLLTLAGNHTEAEDGLHYLVAIRDGDLADNSPAYHLIYHWLGWLIYHAALALGYDGGPLLPVQIFNTFTGALGIALLWVLLRMAVPTEYNRKRCYGAKASDRHLRRYVARAH
jgi:hypothetical protein